MDAPPPSARQASRGPALVALAVTAFILSATGWLERIDHRVLDTAWRIVRSLGPGTAPVEIVVVGIDEATVREIPEPPGLWHDALARVFARIAAAKPKAIGVDVPLPDRSFDHLRPGIDRTLMLGLAAARQGAPLVASLAIDPASRGVRRIHAPLLAVLQEERLGIGLVARDVDGSARRFSIALPTEDGAFPTFAGRLCRALSKRCTDGLIDYGHGPAVRVVPFQAVLGMNDLAALEGLFRDRVVLVGDTSAFGNRIPVPINLAENESRSAQSSTIVVHALSLRTALGEAPQDASRPLSMLLASLPALLLLVRRPLPFALSALAAAAGLAVITVGALRHGVAVPVATAAVTLVLAALVVSYEAVRARPSKGAP